MRSALLLSLLLTVQPPPQPPPGAAKGLVVHEWGIFRVHDDAELANSDALAEWDELPAFMYGQVPGRAVPVDWGVLEIRRRPVVFFHAPEALDLSMRIDFPGGLPGIWWPGTRSPASRGRAPAPVGTALVWQLRLKECPPGKRPQHAGMREVPRGHWVEAMRDVRCDEVFATFGDGPVDVDREKFVFYDGIFPQGKWVGVEVNKGQVALRSRIAHPVFDVTVIDRRGGGPVRLGRLDRLDGGATVESVKMVEVERGRFAAEAGPALVKQLVAAGLYEDEAGSLLAACGKDLLQGDGVTVFYRLPQEEYERRLPMTLTPRPESLVRVGLVQHTHCEPDFAERVAALVKQLDADAFEDREAAQKKLRDLGPAAAVHLARLRKTITSVEAKHRIDELLAPWDARKALGR